MDGTGDAEEFEALREPLPEKPLLRPVHRWASERITGMLARSVVWLAWVGLWVLSMPRAAVGRVYLTLMLTLLGGTGLIWAATVFVRRLRAAACRRSPSEPWRHDRVWSESGETRSWAIRAVQAYVDRAHVRFVAVMFAFVVLLLPTRFAFAWPAVAVASGLGSLLGWWVWRIHGAGDSRLSFTKFPYRPGEPVTLHFGMSEGGAQFKRVEFSLLHVREFEGGMLGMQRGTGVGYRGREHHPPGPLPGPDFDVEVSFDVPAGAPGTCLWAKLPTYWVFEVCGVTSAGPYVERFLVPIYARPEPPATEPVSA